LPIRGLGGKGGGGLFCGRKAAGGAVGVWASNFPRLKKLSPKERGGVSGREKDNLDVRKGEEVAWAFLWARLVFGGGKASVGDSEGDWTQGKEETLAFILEIGEGKERLQ